MTDHSNNGNQPGRPQAPNIPGQQPHITPQHAPVAAPLAAPARHIPPQPGPQEMAQQPQQQMVQPPQVVQQQYQPSQQQRVRVEEQTPAPVEQVEPEQEPPAKFIKHRKKPSRFLKMMQLLMSLSFFAAIGLAGFVMYTRHQVDKPGPLASKTLFEVGKGQGLSAISARLQKDGIINNKRLFAMNAVASKSAKKLKAGKYSIPRAASMQDVLDILVKGKAIFYRITLPEGWTSQQIVKALNAHPQLVGSIGEIPPEGSLMPNTFQFSQGENRSKLLAKMATAQSKYLSENWEKRQPDLPLKNKEEALILASIVEKETGRSSERARVAGVFINRLRKGMKLQSDPTIIYGLVGGKGKLGHPLLRSEMKKKTGYNTYQIAGLPPTPIANPGRLSIEAVLNPAKTKDLFFVANGTGGHSFAPNLKLHNKNVKEWRKIEAKKRREKKLNEAEEKRLTALAAKQKATQPALPGITVSAPTVSQVTLGGKWGNDIPLPTRKPH